MRVARGFTLIEVMIVVAVLAVLAAIALPSYTDYVLRSKLTEAHTHLADLRVKMEQRFQDARTYVGGPCAPTGASATQIRYFDFTCPAAATATTFTIQAAGKASTDLAGIAFTVNESNVRTTTVTGGSTMANKGYGSNAGCWVMRKGSSC
jgi:type IV pilus assembly protein PilE